MLDFSFLTVGRIAFIVLGFAVGFLFSELQRLKKLHKHELARARNQAAVNETEIRNEWRSQLDRQSNKSRRELGELKEELSSLKWGREQAIKHLYDSFYLLMKTDLAYLLTNGSKLELSEMGYAFAKRQLNHYIVQICFLKFSQVEYEEYQADIESCRDSDGNINIFSSDSDLMFLIARLRYITNGSSTTIGSNFFPTQPDPHFAKGYLHGKNYPFQDAERWLLTGYGLKVNSRKD